MKIRKNLFAITIFFRLSVFAGFGFVFAPSVLWAQVTLTKSVNVISASPGNLVTYTLSYSNASANTTCSDTFESDTLGSFPSGWVSSG
ncbi:MAG TPA: hypothetical protein VIJ93_01145, partial [bacterium]